VDRYRVKVKRKKTTYLWGGPGINPASQRILNTQVLLNIHVEDIGETITIGYTTAENPSTSDTFGTLQAGETFTLSLQGLTSVSADCDYDTQVDCYIYTPAAN
jgi:hypothetical protein